MSGVINRINNVLNRFIGPIIGFEFGGFESSRGNHKFIVEINICPKKVWINTDESVPDGCGNIPVNKVGCTSLPGRLIFDVEVETDNCHVFWFAVA